MDIINKGFSAHARPTLKFNKWCKARCDPQPGHFNPVRLKKGHLGNKDVSIGL